MSGTPTPRLGYPTLVAGVDNVAAFPPAFNAMVAIADNAIPYSTGTLADRPSAPTVSPQVYKASDTGLSYWWNGAAWLTMTFAGSGYGSLTPVTISGSATLVAGQLAEVSGTAPTLTLPTPTLGAVIGVLTVGSPSGAQPVEIAAAGSARINGVGSVNVASVVLGTPLAYLEFTADGGNWLITADKRDTGWVPMTLGTNVADAPGYATPAARATGDRMQLRGGLLTTGLTASGATIATAFQAPLSTVPGIMATFGGSATSTQFTIDTSGHLKNVTGQNSGVTIALDQISYPLD